jgi:hypothetical protein
MTDIDELLIEIRSDDAEVRFNAIKQLGQIPNLPHQVLDPLTELTEDPDPKVSIAAKQVLYRKFGVYLSTTEVEEETEIHNNIEELIPTSTLRPEHPWFKIWIKPRETMREILDYDAGYLILPLAMITGFGYSLDRAMSRSFGDDYSITMIIFTVLIVGPLGGLVSVYLGGALFSWVGNKLGGRGDSKDLRAAVAWSSVPWILVIFVSLFLIAIFGEEAFTTLTPRFDARFSSSTGNFVLIGFLILGLTFIGIVLSIWRVVLLVKCVAEAHRFSSWRSLATLAIPFFAVLAAGLICIVSLY